MRHPSPLRYPGGKGILSKFLQDFIELNELSGCNYYEPFAGGAGAALALLNEGVVSEIRLNDADYRVYSLWRSILNETDRFMERIREVPLDIDEWKKQREICAKPSKYKLFDVGFAAFYMNRCNRSGVLTGAGPIGGYQQTGSWRLDVRFNRETLATRVLKLGELREQIRVHNEDAVTFLKRELPSGRGRRNVFVYLDPPYVNKGQRLYLNAYEAEDHKRLSQYVLAQKTLPWVMSYDDSKLVRELYKSCACYNLPIRYSLQDKRDASELVICPPELSKPKFCRISAEVEHPLKAIA